MPYHEIFKYALIFVILLIFCAIHDHIRLHSHYTNIVTPSSSVCLHLVHLVGPLVSFIIFGHAETLTFDLLTFTFDLLIPKPNLFIFVRRCTSDKFGENSLMHTIDIAETTSQTN